MLVLGNNPRIFLWNARYGHRQVAGDALVSVTYSPASLKGTGPELGFSGLGTHSTELRNDELVTLCRISLRGQEEALALTICLQGPAHGLCSVAEVRAGASLGPNAHFLSW